MKVKRALRSAQACDACKRRKVRCNGEQDCNQCTHLSLKCFYSITSPTSRSRRSIVRGRVIESCKYLQAEFDGQNPALQQPVASVALDDQSRSDGSPYFPASFFVDLIAEYCTHVLPTIPIIAEADFRSAINRIHLNQNDCALVYCLGAQTLNVTRTGPGGSPIYSDQVTSLYTKALSCRGPVLSHDQINVQSIMIPLLTSIGLFANHRDIDMGLYYISEAISGIQVLHVDDPEKMALLNAKERAQRERLHWLLYIHERFHSISQYRPALLSALPNPPEWDDSIPAIIHESFSLLIHLFRIVDADFIGNWINRRSPSLTLAWIEKKQAELGDDKDVWKEGIKLLSDMQQVDLIVTRYWLRTLIWQMALTKFVLTLDGQVEQEHMSLAFPVRLSRRLRSLLASKPRQAVEVHGTGILQKIFDITCTLADLLEHMVAKTYDFQTQVGHLEDFVFLHKFLMSMSKFYHLERAVLTSKFETMCSLFPSSFFIQGEMLDTFI